MGLAQPQGSRKGSHRHEQERSPPVQMAPEHDLGAAPAQFPPCSLPTGLAALVAVLAAALSLAALAPALTLDPSVLNRSSALGTRFTLLEAPANASRAAALGDPTAALLSLTVHVVNPGNSLVAICAVPPGAPPLPPFSRMVACGGRAGAALTPEAGDGDDAIVREGEFVARYRAEVPGSLLGADFSIVLEAHNRVLPLTIVAVTGATLHSNRALPYWLGKVSAALGAASEWLRCGWAAAAALPAPAALRGALGAARAAVARALSALHAESLWKRRSGFFSGTSCGASPASQWLARECSALATAVAVVPFGVSSLAAGACASLEKGDVVVPALLLLNLLGFAGEWAAPLSLGAQTGGAHTYLTYQFAHAGWYHFLGNMSALLFTGDEVYAALNCSALAFAALYLLCGASGGLAARLLHRGAPAQLVGASAAVCGVMMALAVLRPRSAISALGVEAGHPLMWALAIVVKDAALNAVTGERISWEGHLGGLLAGFALSQLLLL